MNKGGTVTAVIAIIIAGFALYGNTIKGEFVWDDESLITTNDYVKSTRNIAGLFTKNITYGSTMSGNYYRPLQMVTYLVNYLIWKLNPAPYHITNIIFHISAALVLFWLTLILSESIPIASIASFLFVIHPIHTEAVAYISGRPDPMVATFIFLTVGCHIKHSRASFFFFILALLSKEIALVVPLLLIAYEYIYSGLNGASLKRCLGFIVIGITYVILRTTILNFSTVNPIAGYTLSQRLPAVFNSFAMFVQKLILPLGLHMEYEIVMPAINEPRVIAGIAIMSALLFAMAAVRKNHKLVTFSIAWFLINYLPVSNIYPITGVFAEHWIYVPSAGVFILAGWAAVKLWGKGWAYRAPLMALALIMLSFYPYLTIKQNMNWKDGERCFKMVLKYNERSARVHNNLGLMYYQKGKDDEAIKLFEKSLEIDPNDARTYNNLAVLYHMHRNEKEKAIGLFRKSIAIDPNYADARYNLAVLYDERVEKEKALKLYEEVIEINPFFQSAYSNMGNIYIYFGKYKESIAILKKALESGPPHEVVYNNLAIAYFGDKQYDKAVKACDKALELGGKVNQEFLDMLKPYRRK